MRFTNFVIIFHLFSITIQEEVDIELFESFIEEFDLKHPLLMTNDKSMTINLTKKLFKKGNYCGFNSMSPLDDKNNNTSVIIINNYMNISDLIELQKSSETMVIFGNDKDFENIKMSLKVPIDKRVFLVNKSSKEVFETYHIGDHNIHQRLGKFNNYTNDFIWTKGIEKDHIKRRSNFHGIELKAMTETIGSFIMLDSEYVQNAKYFSENETYLVNDYVSGSFHDIFLEFQSQLNFTTKFFKRKEISWGHVYPQQNGSFVATGMVSDLFFNRADLAVTSLFINTERAKYIDFLIQLDSPKIGLYIPLESSKGEFDYDIFLSPFR